MAVEILRLTGLAHADAERVTRELLADYHGHPDLSRLLVLDDTALLVQRTPIYERLGTANRVSDLLCLASGPRPGTGRALELPGNLGGTQGAGVLWVSDPHGIDWRMATSAIAIGHPVGPVSGLHLLVELLSVDEVFNQVHAMMMASVPGKVANPGLRLAGSDDEAITFAGALASAIQRLTESGPGFDGPFPALLPTAAGRVSLANGGELSRRHADVAESVGAAADALVKLTGIGGVLRRSDAGLRHHLIEAGAALTDFRSRVARLLRDANTAGELTDNQRKQVLATGLRLPSPSPAATENGAAPGGSTQSPVYRVVAEAVRGGDTLALVTRRLTATERQLKTHGSASYLPKVEQQCPPFLLDRLAGPPERLPRHGSAEVLRQELGLDAAIEAADGLADLVVTVADREWSGATVTSGEVARIRIAMGGVGQALIEHAQPAGDAGSGERGARLARLGETLAPILCDLVLRVLAAESTSPSGGGQEAFDRGHERAATLLTAWTKHVHANGVLSQPPFATSSVHEVPYADEDDVSAIKEAILYEPSQVMWQLCTPDDLGTLDAVASPRVVRFAPRLNKDALVGTLPPDTAWMSSGSHAGLLRLVPLRAGIASSNWRNDRHLADPPHVTGPSS
ncbi:MAG: hypothetical protein ACRDNF_11720 [Streptosporangiaceae bacterium]